MKRFLFLSLLAALPCAGATLQIDARNTFIGFSNPFTDSEGVPLTSSNLAELGFYLTGEAPVTEGDSFDGFTPIDSAVIDLGLNGTFDRTFNLDNTNTTDFPAGTPSTLRFAIRFFDGPDEASSSFYNIVTNEAWEFSFSSANPQPLPSEMFLDPVTGQATVDSSIWAGGSSSAFRTTVPVPEPGSSLVLVLGSALLLGKRRR